MGFAERKQEDKAEVQETKAQLLDESTLFPGKPLPFKEVDFEGADGTKGRVLIQAISLQDIDEVNHIQAQPVMDARGNVIQEANDIGWDAKIVAKALRKPNKMPLGGEHWLALSEKIMGQWLPGTIKFIRTEVLKLSGYTQLTVTQQKKG